MFLDAEMDVRIRERDLIECDLPSAVHSGAVQPYYQPLVDLHTGQIVGSDLARWIHPGLAAFS